MCIKWYQIVFHACTHILIPNSSKSQYLISCVCITTFPSTCEKCVNSKLWRVCIQSTVVVVIGHCPSSPWQIGCHCFQNCGEGDSTVMHASHKAMKWFDQGKCAMIWFKPFLKCAMTPVYFEKLTSTSSNCKSTLEGGHVPRGILAQGVSSGGLGFCCMDNALIL